MFVAISKSPRRDPKGRSAKTYKEDCFITNCRHFGDFIFSVPLCEPRFSAGLERKKEFRWNLIARPTKPF